MALRISRWIFITLTVFLLITIIGLTNTFNKNDRPEKASPDNRLTIMQSIDQLNVPSVTDPDGQKYLSLFALMDSLSYKHLYKQEANTHLFGFIDPEMEYRPGEGRIIPIEEPELAIGVMMRDGEPYLKQSDIPELFQFIPQEQIEKITDEDFSAIMDSGNDTGNGEEAGNGNGIGDNIGTDNDNNPGLFSINRFNSNQLINLAKRELGTPYVFGAPTTTTRIFDCSSFTKYVFRQQGVRLPRTARLQSRLGQRVSIKELRKGDLMFFYVPGRYASNNIVGHVGIYMGNGKVIHAYPPGVKIGSLSELKKYYLFSKRIG